MQGTQVKTVNEFSEYIWDFYQDVTPKAIQGQIGIQSYKRVIFSAFFGEGTFGTGPAEKTVTYEGLIDFEDSPGGPFDKRAKGFTQAGFILLMKELDSLKKDSIFKKNLIDQLNSNPMLKQHLVRVQDTIIKLIIHRRASCNILVIQPNVPSMQQSSIDEGKPDTIFGFNIPIPTLLQPFANIIKRIKNLVEDYTRSEINLKSIVQLKNEISKRIGSSFSIIAWSAIFSGVRKKFGKIPILLGPVPLKHVDYVEIARSGKILKFRATGSVFLAKQEGGADAIKIEGIMYKVEFLIMLLLWGLFVYGQSKFKELDDLPNLLGAQNVFEVRKMNDLIMTDSTLQRPSYEFHHTFPFVSRHFIIPHCYIETILIEDKLPLKDVLKYSILLRTYDKPKEVNYVEGKKGKSLYGIADKSSSAKICEASLNAGWRMLNATGWLIDETDWKIGSATKEGVLDTYYDVDQSTYATIGYLTLMGAVT